MCIVEFITFILSNVATIEFMVEAPIPDQKLIYRVLGLGLG